MKLFASTQIRELDTYTIEHEPIRSIDLMERAARAIVRAITARWDTSTSVIVFAGPGNNGGDALAVSRMLSQQGYDVRVWLFNINNRLSDDCSINRQRIEEAGKVEFHEVINEFDPPVLSAGMLVIDGLFGTGLSKTLAGGFSALVKYINQSEATVVSIDMPSGLMSEDNTYNVDANIIRADLTLTLQNKKLAFLFAENQKFIGRLEILDIQLSEEGMRRIDSQYTILTHNEATRLLRPRSPFAHKGSMGNVLMVAGTYGMAGAAILAARACLRSGTGKLTLHTPRCNNDILQISVPEAVLQHDKDEHIYTEAVDAAAFDALAIGPGLGQQESSAIAMITQVRRTQAPVVLDADALNILATHRAWLQQLPKNVVLTPHPKEFDRLNGTQSTDSFDRLSKARDLSERLQAFIILKGHYSALCTPDGRVCFNSSGNAGMATAGSGDVLTGIIAALLGRGYPHKDACLLGMYLHGLAGDLAAQSIGMESLTATDIINHLPQAFLALENKR